MTIRGHISLQGDGMGISIRSMMTQMSILNIHTDNIANYAVPGYQRKDPVITSFAEYLGPDAVDKATSTEVGRVRNSGYPLDFALNTEGYFQKLNGQNGVELTRDGRFKLDKDGFLLSLDDKKVLSASGSPIQLTHIPQDLERHLKVSPNGEIKVFDPDKGDIVFTDTLGIATKEGTLTREVDVRQGHVEDSNVVLQKEVVQMMPLRRQFEANRQLFLIQSDTLSKTIQELGRAQ